MGVSTAGRSGAGGAGRTSTPPAGSGTGRRGNRSNRRRKRPAPPEASAARQWLVALAVLSSLVGLALLVLYLAPELQARSQWLAMAASFAPYGWLAWVLALVLALAGTRGRTRLLAAPLALGLAWHTAVLTPYLPGPGRAVAAAPVSLTVLALNLRFGLADLTQLAGVARSGRPDVLVLTEVTEHDAKAFARTTWSRSFPYRSGTAGADYDAATDSGDARGTMVLSRVPITPADTTGDTRFTNLAVRLDLAGKQVTLIAAHPANPMHGVENWLGDGEAVTRMALAHTGGPLVVAGDLNATAEHLTLRELIAKAGLTDTATGIGWHPTYPADEWYPPLLQIDHVLTSDDFSTTAFGTFRVAGTDHLGLLVTLALR